MAASLSLLRARRAAWRGALMTVTLAAAGAIWAQPAPGCYIYRYCISTGQLLSARLPDLAPPSLVDARGGFTGYFRPAVVNSFGIASVVCAAVKYDSSFSTDENTFYL